MTRMTNSEEFFSSDVTNPLKKLVLFSKALIKQPELYFKL